MLFDWSFALSILPQLLTASLTTIGITAASFALAAVGGLLLAGLRSVRWRWLAWTVTACVDFIRSTPLLLQIFFAYYVLPGYGIDLGGIGSGVAVLALHYSCYLSESYRAAFAAVPIAQKQAAQALGMTTAQTFRYVVWPQILPIVVPVGGSLMVFMFKDTPVLAAVTVREMLQVSSQIGADHFRYMEPVTLVGLLFLVMSLVAAKLTRIIERRVALPHRPRP